jgi:hypothetical protein
MYIWDSAEPKLVEANSIRVQNQFYLFYDSGLVMSWSLDAAQELDVSLEAL